MHLVWWQAQIWSWFTGLARDYSGEVIVWALLALVMYSFVCAGVRK